MELVPRFRPDLFFATSCWLGFSAGASGVLADPILRVYRQPVSAPLFQNDDWTSPSNAGQIAIAAKNVSAFSLVGSTKDLALSLTLQPRIYSAVVTGAGTSTGVALVEVYDDD